MRPSIMRKLEKPTNFQKIRQGDLPHSEMSKGEFIHFCLPGRQAKLLTDKVSH